MKKILSIMLVAILLVTLMPIYVFAENGPMGTITWDGTEYELAYISFYTPGESGSTKEVYAQQTTNNNAVSGATYDKSTNTLTLNNVSTTQALETNVMGDDFKIKLVGTNKIGQLSVWGDGYGGSLKLTGTGTLTINEDKNDYYYAIRMPAEGSNSKLYVDSTVTLNLYASTNVIYLYGTTASSNGITFANGQKISVTKDGSSNNYSYTVEGTSLTVSGIKKETSTTTIKPTATSLVKLTPKSKAFTVKWKKVTKQVKGYQIQYSTNKKFKSGNKTVSIGKNTTITKTIKKLKAKKKYYVRIRTYQVANGKTYYSSWSASKNVTTKK